MPLQPITTTADARLAAAKRLLSDAARAALRGDPDAPARVLEAQAAVAEARAQARIPESHEDE
jgi:hypothetical protein